MNCQMIRVISSPSSLDDCAFDLDLRHAANLSNETVRILARLQATGGRYTRSTRSCGRCNLSYSSSLGIQSVSQRSIRP